MARTDADKEAATAPMAVPDVLTVDQLAAYLQLAKSTLYKLLRENKIPGTKLGRHWRFRRDAIDAWLDQSGQRAVKARRSSSPSRGHR